MLLIGKNKTKLMENLEQKSISDNELIAKFIGWEVSKSGKKFKNYLPPHGYVKVHPDHMKFHTSWDWLMPVIDHIEELGGVVTIKGDACIIELGKKSFCVETGIKIQSLYETIVNFIKWYYGITIIGIVGKYTKKP